MEELAKQWESIEKLVYLISSLPLLQTPAGLAPGVSSFLQMAVSFTYRYLALFTDTGYIWMGTASLKVWLWNNKGRAIVDRVMAFEQQDDCWDRAMTCCAISGEAVRVQLQHPGTPEADGLVRREASFKAGLRTLFPGIT